MPRPASLIELEQGDQVTRRTRWRRIGRAVPRSLRRPVFMLMLGCIATASVSWALAIARAPAAGAIRGNDPTSGELRIPIQSESETHHPRGTARLYVSKRVIGAAAVLAYPPHPSQDLDAVPFGKPPQWSRARAYVGGADQGANQVRWERAFGCPCSPSAPNSTASTTRAQPGSIRERCGARARPNPASGSDTPPSGCMRSRAISASDCRGILTFSPPGWLTSPPCSPLPRSGRGFLSTPCSTPSPGRGCSGRCDASITASRVPSDGGGCSNAVAARAAATHSATSPAVPSAATT